MILIFTLYSCTKIDQPAQHPDEPFKSQEHSVSLLATASSPSKISYTPTADSSIYAFSWDALDELSVIVGESANDNQKFTVQSSTNTSLIDGKLYSWEGEKTLVAVYPYIPEGYAIDLNAQSLKVEQSALVHNLSLENNLTNTLMVGSASGVDFNAHGELNLPQISLSQVTSLFQIDFVDIPHGQSIVEIYFKAPQELFVKSADISFVDAQIIDGTQVFSDSISMRVVQQSSERAQITMPLLPCDLTGVTFQMVVVCENNQGKILYIENFENGLKFEHNSIATQENGNFSLLKDSDQIIGGDGLTLSKVAGGYVPQGDHWVFVDYNATSESFQGLRTLLTSLDDTDREISITFENLHTIPSNALSRDSRAGRSALVSISAPWVSKLEREAFLNCRSLQSVNLPKVYEIEAKALGYCTSLQTLSLSEVEIIGERALYYCDALEELSMPKLRSANSRAFEYCGSLKSMSLPSLEELGDWALNYCDSLKNVDFPNLRSVGERAFSDCHSLNEVLFENLTATSQQAFYDCESLGKVSLPSLITPSKGLFENCTSLHTLELATMNDKTKLYSLAEGIFDLPFGKTQQANITLTLGEANRDLLEGNTLTIGSHSYIFKEIIISQRSNAQINP